MADAQVLEFSSVHTLGSGGGYFSSVLKPATPSDADAWVGGGSNFAFSRPSMRALSETTDSLFLAFVAAAGATGAAVSAFPSPTTAQTPATWSRKQKTRVTTTS